MALDALAELVGGVALFEIQVTDAVFFAGLDDHILDAVADKALEQDDEVEGASFDALGQGFEAFGVVGGVPFEVGEAKGELDFGADVFALVFAADDDGALSLGVMTPGPEAEEVGGVGRGCCVWGGRGG